MMNKTAKRLPIVMSCVPMALMSACGGGGGGGGSPNPGGSVDYQVSATAGAGGTISPATATVNAGGTTTLTVTPNTGYVVGSVTGCGGTLSGNSYTTGAISASCTVTASFAPAFTWVGGSSSPDATAIYGTQGVTAATNMPGSRDAGATWTDLSGNLWMFGGFSGYGAPLNPAAGNFLNDLWKYSPSSGQWTWIAGSSTACPQAVYGTQGVAAATNAPGPRSASMHWSDASGNAWMYGGGGCDTTGAFVAYGDLWELSPTSGEWTWVGGATTSYANPVYGTRGVAAPTNTPGARFSAATWMDANGNVVMFGGYGVPGAHLNDLWKYLPASNQWVWIGGPDTANGMGVYGVQGVADAANVPGARGGSVHWTDAQGDFWLFGGYGYDSTGAQQGLLNDLWKYSPSTGQWTWVGGSNTINAAGTYGTQGVAAAANVPPARDSAASWTDAGGNVFVFGGEVFDVPTHTYHRLNDLWKYSPSSGQWTWVAGANTYDATGTYGAKGLAAGTNMPGARAAPFTWKDAAGTVWLFGGFQYDDPTNTRFEMGDLWTYPAQ
jgi:hypothetical protein